MLAFNASDNLFDNMTEIILRAWHLPTKEMFWFDVMNGNHSHGQGWIGMAPFGEPISKVRYRDNLISVDPSNCELMLQLDILDKNGINYHFNDIVQTAQGIGVLEWFGDRLGISSGEIGNYHATDEISREELECAEIVGNIYQHAHLLAGDLYQVIGTAEIVPNQPTGYHQNINKPTGYHENLNK